MNSICRALAAGCVVCGALRPAAADAFLLKDAKVVYEQGLLKGAKRDWGRCALDDLTNLLARTTGSRIEAFPESSCLEDGRPAIYLGDTKAARAAGIDVGALAPNEFRMKVVQGAAYLVGRSGAGSSFAVTEFLKRFADCRFQTCTGDDPYTVDPSRTAKECDIGRKSTFCGMSNGTHGYGGRYPETMGNRYRWTKRLRSGFKIAEMGPAYEVSRLPGRCHSQFMYCPPLKYAKEHPEYYSMNAEGRRMKPGVDTGTQFCFSNPDVYRICLDSLVRFVEEEVAKDPVNYPRIYDFSQEDNSSFLCKCPECRKIIARHDRKGGFKDGGDAGLQLEFVNRLARDIRKKYPEVKVRTFAYCSTEEPPKDIVPEENVIIWLCDLYTTCDHQLPLTHPFNRRHMELFREWKALARHVEVWDYTLWDGPYAGGRNDCLQVFPDASAADARFMRELGIESIYIENHFDGQSLWEFNTFVQMELFFDPDQDIDELIDAYCKVYGKGGRDMRELIEFLRRIIRDNPPENVACWHSRLLPWRTSANFEHILELALRAYDVADTLPARRRIAAVVVGAMQELVVQYRSRPDKADRIAWIMERFPRFVSEALETGWIKGKSLENERKQYEDFATLATLKFDNLPPGLKNVDRKDLLYFAHHTASPGGRGKVVADPASECGKSVRWNAAKMRPDAVPPFAGWVQSQGEKPVGFKFSPPADGSYGWTRLGKFHLGPNAKLCFNYGYHWNIYSAYTLSDGADSDPNWFEIWLSSRLAGAAGSKDAKEGLFCDRVLLRRLPAGYWFVVNEDNDHFFKLPSSEMTVDGLTGYADFIARGKVTHVFLCVCGQRTSYDSKTWEPIWAGIGERARKDTATMPDGTHDRWAVNCKILKDKGIDPYEVWIKRFREKGVSPWLSMRMNDVHFATDTNYFRNTTFHKTHRELWLNPDARNNRECQFDYSRPEVREYNLAQIREIADRWDSDGLELDWMRFGNVFKYGREREDAHHLDAFMQEVRTILDAASKRRGRRMGLAVRVPPTPAEAESLGFNVLEWARKGLVDVGVADDFIKMRADIPVDEWLRKLAGTKTMLLPGTGGSMPNGVPRKELPAAYRGLADVYYGKGAKGIYVFNLPYFSNRKYSTDGGGDDKLDVAAILYREGLSPADISGRPVRLP